MTEMAGTSLALQIQEGAAYVSEQLGDVKPDIGITLGSGLGPLAASIEAPSGYDAPIVIPYGHVPHMRVSTAMQHAGQWVCGNLAGNTVLAMQGRLHGYEGYSSADTVFPVRLMHALGLDTLIVSNAAGAINENYQAGDFCLIVDHINFTGANPIVGQEPDELSQRFFSMYEAYDPALGKIAQQVADDQGVHLHESVYLGLRGPSFETAAEIRAFRIWGADLVGMSTVEEVIAARHLGMRVLGISLVTNMACGVNQASPNDMEAFATAMGRAGAFSSLLEETVRRIEVPAQ